MGLLNVPLPYDPTQIFNNPLVEVTQSMIKTFMRCRQRYVFRYLLQLASRIVVKPLIVGGATHTGWEVFLGYCKGAKEVEFLIHLEEAHAAANNKFDEIYEDSTLIIPNPDVMEHGRVQVLAMLKAWALRYSGELPFRVVTVEQVARKLPEATLESPLWMRMGGRLDATVTDVEDYPDLYFVLENKTRSTLKGFDFVSGLNLDLQALWYLTLVITRDELPIEGFFYNAIAKPAHRAAASQDALQDKMVEAMCGDDKYFFFSPILIDEDIRCQHYANWGRELRMMDTLSVDTVTMSTAACDDYGGCPYKKLCLLGADARFPERVLDIPQTELYYFRDPYTELEED